MRTDARTKLHKIQIGTCSQLTRTRQCCELSVEEKRNMMCFKYIVAMMAVVLSMLMTADGTIPQPRAPNFQYFERPNYRYPYYDENGKGKLLYGYGGPELYQYKSYSPLEGIY